MSEQIYNVLGDRYRFLVGGPDCNGAYAVMEGEVPPGGGPPPHIHTREEETFLVLEGQITFSVEGEEIVAGPGRFLRVPRGVRHNFCNRTSEPAKVIVTVVPAGLDEFFKSVGRPLTPDESPTPPTPEDIARVLELAPEYGLQILPPG